MIELGVNIDHVATVRQARLGIYPSPVEAALLAEQGGAKWITAHLREDRRHVQDHDIQLLREKSSIPFNLEMANTQEMLQIASQVKPEQVTFVPEKREELTTEGGLDVKSHFEKLKEAVQTLKERQIKVSFFIDPDEEQIQASYEAGAELIELHTGYYANSDQAQANHNVQLDRLIQAGSKAAELGLVVNAGHGLTYENVKLMKKIPQLKQLHIGHGIVARSIFIGMQEAVKEIMRIINESN